MTGRRLVYPGAAVLALATACIGVAQGRPPKEAIPPTRPNVLIFVTDDQRATGTMRVMPETRYWFGQGGTRFTHAFATTPLCCPSRSSLFTGRYAHNHGIRVNEDARGLDQRTTLQATLQAAGYRTMLVGKYLNGWSIEEDPPNFDGWAVLQGYGYFNPIENIGGSVRQVRGYHTTYVGELVRQLLGLTETQDGRPWLMYVTLKAPHAPFRPAPEDEDASVPPRRPTPAVRERDVSDKPPWVQHPPDFGGWTPASIRAQQLRTLRSADRVVGDVFEELGDLGERRYTMAFFLSDQGYAWGEHGVVGKRTPYPESTHIPLYMRWPGHVDRGATDGRLAATIDIAPTVLDSVGVETRSWMDGRSLLQDWHRDRLLLEHWTDPLSWVPNWASTITKAYQYVEYYQHGRTIFREYYDLQSDPWERKNLLTRGRTANHETLSILHRRLMNERSCSGESCR